MLTGIRQKRCGFNAIELVVVILVVFILIGVVLTVLKIQRDSERTIGLGDRTQTNNNLKQLSLAMHSCQDVFKRMPPAFDSFGAMNFPASIHIHLMPYIEQDPLYTRYFEAEGKGEIATKAIVPPFICPQDISQVNSGAGFQNFAANLRVFSSKGMTTNFDANMPALAGIEPGKATIPASFPDGTSNTILFTLKYGSCQDGGSRYVAAPDSPFAAFFGQNAATITARPSDPRATFQAQPTANQCLTTPLMAQSMSQRGLSVGMADGSVRILSLDLSPRTWNLAVQPNDGFDLGDDW